MGIVIGIIGTSYAAYKLTAKEVSFDKTNSNLNSENVQDSIDEIADKLKYGDATEGDIASGKTALVNGNKIIGKANKTDYLLLRLFVHTGKFASCYSTGGYIYNDGKIKHIYYRRISTSGGASTNMAALSGGASTINLGTSTSDSFVEYELGDSWKAVSVMGASNEQISYIIIEFKISYVD